MNDKDYENLIVACINQLEDDTKADEITIKFNAFAKYRITIKAERLEND